MTDDPIDIRVGDAPELEVFLAERVYEFNAEATGYRDGESFSAMRQDDTGAVFAGISGYTWGGCCYVSYLWVLGSRRGRGIGARLMQAAETHARRKGCVVMLLSTHDFQAPGFYERLGFERQAVVADHPPGHASIILARRLQAST